MNLDSKIYVAGHRGLVGSAIWKSLKEQGYTNLIGRTSKELDLRDPIAVKKFFEEEKPEYVFLAAAHVGGIMANNIYRADFIYRNLAIQQNVIGQSFETGVKKLLFLGSTCIYPKNAPQPMKEDTLLSSELEYTNEPYAIAKIAGLKMCESFNIQYGTNFIACMPTNLYGPNDNFDLEKSHVLPAMMRKMILAKYLNQNKFDEIRDDLRKRPISYIDNIDTISNEEIEKILNEKFAIYRDRLELWGTGTPMREFLWSEDMADACVFLMKNVESKELIGDDKEIRNCHINIGTGRDLSIAELANIMKNLIGYEGNISFDASKPDGTMRKLTDPSKLNSLGWKHKVEIEEGIKRIYDWYRQR